MGEDRRYEPPPDIDRCPLAVGGERCSVVKHSFRDRKTGPQVALRILHCKLHDRYFTVYPMGHVPHGRQSVAAVDLGGKPLEYWKSEHEDRSSELDAAWPPISERTQRRRTEHDALLLGLAPKLPHRVVEEICYHLGVVGIDHHTACRQFQQAGSVPARVATILDVQQQVATGPSRVLRLLAAGFLSDLWGHPFCWDVFYGQRFSLLSATSRALRAPANYQFVL